MCTHVFLKPNIFISLFKKKKTAMHRAVQSGMVEMVFGLVGAGANVNAPNVLDGWTPFHCAVMGGKKKRKEKKISHFNPLMLRKCRHGEKFVEASRRSTCNHVGRYDFAAHCGCV